MYCMENGDVSWYRIRFVFFVRLVWIRVNVEVKAAKVLCVGSECTIFFIFGAFLKKKMVFEIRGSNNMQELGQCSDVV